MSDDTEVIWKANKCSVAGNEIQTQLHGEHNDFDMMAA